MALESADTRLNKFISETGIVSRREADRLIEEGAIKVNGRKAEMGMRVNASDRVTVRGKPLRAKPSPVYLLYNKPAGIICTTDPEVPENIVDAVNYPQRIFPIGRLDKPSQGLILLTNDGDIVNKILRAGNAHEKEYQVRVDRPIGADFIERMSVGIPILGTVTRPCKVRQTGSNSFTIVLTQGLNRQIRRMTEYLGVEVTYLKRVRLMNIQLGRLATGQWRALTPEEMNTLEGKLGNSSKTEEASREKHKSKTKPDSTPARQATGKPKPSNKPKTLHKPKALKKRETLGKSGSSAKKTAYKGAGKSQSTKPGSTKPRSTQRSPRGRS